MISADEMEKLAAEIFGDTSGMSKVTLIPSSSQAEEDAAAEAARVKAMTDAMDDDARTGLEELNKRLLEWQQTEDSEEALATIPQLNLSDIDPMPQLIATEEKEICGARVLFHPVATNGIIHLNAYFPITQLSLSELPGAALITEFFKDLPTENFNVLSLQNEIRMYIGAISFGLDILAKDNDRRECTPCIRVRASVLKENLKQAEELILEIMTGTRFEDKSMMRELITQIDEDSKRSAVSQGHRLALFEARSHWSARDAAAEAINGHSFMQYMHGMSSASDDDLDGFTAFANGVIEKSINRNNAIISVTADSCPDMTGFIEMLPDGETMPEKTSYVSALPRKMGIELPAAVSYAIIAYDMASDGHKMNGSMQVAANMISLTHLWNTIRVQGGAYGASMTAGRTGSLFCYTYRDPSPARSLDVFKTIPEFLAESTNSEDMDIDGFIISTIAATEPLISPAAKGRSADDFYLSGFTDEDRIRIRKEMLNTKASDLAGLSKVLGDMAEKGTICVAGQKSALETCEGLEIFAL
jgi:Zn-dependent M16 (insulinase) family peptidase